jgi:hypothetical protein
MPAFEIKDYSWGTYKQQGALDSRPKYIMNITSVAQTGGITHRAIIYFEESPAQLGSIDNVDQPNRGYYIVTYWPRSDLTHFYDVLRSERPVLFSFGYTPSGYDPNTPRRELTLAYFFTGFEPLGEGPGETLPGVSLSEMRFALSNAGAPGSTDASGRGSVQE